MADGKGISLFEEFGVSIGTCVKPNWKRALQRAMSQAWLGNRVNPPPV